MGNFHQATVVESNDDADDVRPSTKHAFKIRAWKLVLSDVQTDRLEPEGIEIVDSEVYSQNKWKLFLNRYLPR